MKNNTATSTRPGKPITREDLLAYPDGTWIMTDHEITKILDTEFWTRPRPSGSNGYWWRRKQLMDQLGMVA
jgi:hypothetical protein